MVVVVARRISSQSSPTHSNNRHQTRPPSDELEAFFEDFFKALWVYRIELAVLAPFFFAFTAVYWQVNLPWAVVVTAISVAAFCCWKSARQWVWRCLDRSSVRRQWNKALEKAGLCVPLKGLPVVKTVERVLAGHRVTIELPPGSSISHLEREAERIAVALRVREIRIERNPKDAALGTVTLVRKDIFNTPVSGYPQVQKSLPSFWWPIPIGVDESGQSIAVELPERNLLVGGEPGSGKSLALTTIVATAAADRRVDLWLFDGKTVELACWRECAKAFIGPDAYQAVKALERLCKMMDGRYETLGQRELRKVTKSSDMLLQVVVIDELAFYTTLPDRAVRDAFTRLLRDLVARGRAAGIIVIAATQKPSSEIIPTSLRDLFGFRLAMRCNTRDASDTILGSGWATNGIDASKIPGSQRGVGYLFKEESQPMKIRTYHFSDLDISKIVQRAKDKRDTPLRSNPAIGSGLADCNKPL